MGVVRTPENFQGAHASVTSRGHLCDSSAFLLVVLIARSKHAIDKPRLIVDKVIAIIKGCSFLGPSCSVYNVHAWLWRQQVARYNQFIDGSARKQCSITEFYVLPSSLPAYIRLHVANRQNSVLWCYVATNWLVQNICQQHTTRSVCWETDSHKQHSFQSEILRRSLSRSHSATSTSYKYIITC